ncbi:MAG: DUF4265 domain-containing protein [Fimbriimonadaceae bacterium]
METTQFTHPHPVWKDLADHILVAIDDDESGITHEHLWAKRVDENLYELCCVPAIVRQMALGDVVRANANFDVQEVVRPSGRFVFRAYSEVTWAEKQEVIVKLRALGALVEPCSINLLAIDAKDVATAKRTRKYLVSCEDEGLLVYETGWN